MKAKILLIGLVLAAAAVAAYGQIQVKGTRNECQMINQQFDRLLGTAGVRIDCGVAAESATGDYIDVAFAKIRSNLTLLQAKQ